MKFSLISGNFKGAIDSTDELLSIAPEDDALRMDRKHFAEKLLQYPQTDVLPQLTVCIRLMRIVN